MKKLAFDKGYLQALLECFSKLDELMLDHHASRGDKKSTMMSLLRSQNSLYPWREVGAGWLAAASSPCQRAAYHSTTSLYIPVAIMATDAPSKAPSKAPQHIRPVHRGPRNCSDLAGEAPYSYACTLPDSTSPVELCPPHWRLRERQPLKAKLCAILLKDWQSLSFQPVAASPSCRGTLERPTMIRMKDSDDYITARGANPRTGLISPSVGSPGTPESPAEALKLRKEPASPTRDARNRPILRRASEGRKVSAGGATLRDKDNARAVDGMGAVASPRVTAENVDAASMLDRDRFVVKMPSAQEPQPYAFPGCSAREIQAFAHYKDKARRASREGYDQRILQAARQASGGWESVDQERICLHGAHGPSGVTATAPNRDITVLKCRARMQDKEDVDPETVHEGGAELRVVNFASFSRARTPAIRSNTTTATSLNTLAPPAEGLEIHKPIARKPVEWRTETKGLQSLPPVRLAPPCLAGLPRTQHDKLEYRSVNESRKCSSGCLKDSTDCIWMASNASTPPNERVPLFEGPEHTVKVSSSQHMDFPDPLYDRHWLSDVIIRTLVSLFEVSKHIRLPSVSVPVLETLQSEHAPTEQKVEAMKRVVYATGQVLGLITAVVMLWSLGSGLVRLFEVLFWPLSVPLSIVRWIAGV